MTRFLHVTSNLRALVLGRFKLHGSVIRTYSLNTS